MKKIVIGLHILLLTAFFSKVTLWTAQKPKKAQVHFIKKQIQSPASSLKSKPQVAAHQSTPHQKKAPSPKPHTTQKSKPAPVVTKKTQKTKAPVQTKKPLDIPSSSKDTIAKIEEKLEKLENMSKNVIETAAKEPLNSDAISTEHDDNSLSFCVQYLFELLELPGPGKVTVELLLTKDGQIENIEILDSENEDNSRYLKDKLMNIVLPFEKKNQIPASLKVCFSNLKY